MVDMNSLTTRTFPFLQSYFPTYLHSHSHNSPLHLMQNFPILHNTNPTTMDRGGGGSGDYYYYHHHHHHHASPEGSSRSDVSNTSGGFHQPTPPSRYESQKRRDWNTFGQYLKNQRPPVALSQCTCNHVLDFLRYLDQFGKTKVHLQGCMFYGQPEPPAPCACPLRQAWGSLDALIGRLRAAYEENGGSPETNPFASSGIRVYLREVRDSQAKARGIPYKKKKKNPPASTSKGDQSPSPSSSSSTSMHFS